MNTFRLALLALVAISPVSVNAKDPPARIKRAPKAAPPPMSRQQIVTSIGLEFDKNDKDHDGYLSWQEWEASSHNSPGPSAKIVFDHMDRDHDNRLARQEMVDWSEYMFDCIDQNRDGKISNAESQSRLQFCTAVTTGVVPQ